MTLEQTTDRIDSKTAKRKETSLSEFFTFPDGQRLPMVIRNDNHSDLLHTFINSYNGGKKPVFLSQIINIDEKYQCRSAMESKEKVLNAIKVLRRDLGNHTTWSIQSLDSPRDLSLKKVLDPSWTLAPEKKTPSLSEVKKNCVILVDGKEFKAKSLFDQMLLEKSRLGTTLEELETIFIDCNKGKSSTDYYVVRSLVLKHLEKINQELKVGDVWISFHVPDAFEKPGTIHAVQMMKKTLTSSPETQSPKA